MKRERTSVLVGLLAGIGLSGIAAVLMAQTSQWGFVQDNGYQQLTSLSSATRLTVPDGTSYATICAEVAALRWLANGTAPTTTVGNPIPAGSCMSYVGSLPAVQLIQQTSGGIADVNYYK